jgi:hypothetical protein
VEATNQIDARCDVVNAFGNPDSFLCYEGRHVAFAIFLPAIASGKQTSSDAMDNRL